MAIRRLLPPEPVLIPSNARAEGKSHTEHEKEIPIIICTGIHGRAQEVAAFAAALDKVYQGKSPIYICKSSFPDNRDAKNIADAILRVRNYSLYPCILIGFSYGALLACKIAETLRYDYPERSYESVYCGIDALSPEHTLNYLDSNLPNANLHLLNIMNYAANIAGLTPLTPSEAIFEDVKLFQIERKFDELTEKIKQAQINQNDDNLRRFANIIEVVKQNIMHLIKIYPYINNKLKSGHFFFTHETNQRLTDISQDTAQKDLSGGWKDCCEKVHVMQSSNGELESLTHLELMKEANVEKLAQLISTSIANDVNLTLKSVAPHIIKKTFHRDTLDQQYVEALKTIIPTFVRNTFQGLFLDAKTISEIATEAIQLFTEEVLFRKQTGQHCSMFKPISILRKSQNDATNSVASVESRSSSPFTPSSPVKVK